MADVWELRGRSLEHRSVNVAAAVELAADPNSVVWIQVTPDEMTHIGPLLDIHPRAVEEVISNSNGDGIGAHRTKLERFPRCVLFYLYRSVLGGDARARTS